MLEEAARSGGEALRLEISERFEYSLDFVAAGAGDVEVDCGGLKIVLDPGSASRADGISIGLVDGPQGSQLTIDNPNEPPRVREISATELRAMMDRGASFELVDVRTPAERATAMIAGSRLLDQETYELLLGMDRNAAIVFHCHFGDRSRSAAEHFRQQGFLNLCNVQGGIDAWSRLVDPAVPRY